MLSNMVWFGCVVARYGPPGFQELWRELQPALAHYLYARDASPHAMNAAHAHLWRYAQIVERNVLEGAVRR